MIAPQGTENVDLTLLDPSVAPGDDFYRHANGAWLSSYELPPNKSRFGNFYALHESSQERVQTLIEELAETTPEKGSIEQKIGDYYASFLDTETLDKLGFDEFWCGEHHSTGWETIGSPEMFLAAAAAALLPGITSKAALTPAVAVVFIWAAALVFARTAFFDLLDVQGDRIMGKETLPILLGNRRTIVLLKGMLTGCVLLIATATVSATANVNSRSWSCCRRAIPPAKLPR